jgi:ankyrin repeat protein
MADHAGRSPLHYAVFNNYPGQIRMIQQLLMYGANINCLDENRRTPLHFAAMEGRSNIIPLLVQNGAGAGLKDYQG